MNTLKQVANKQDKTLKRVNITLDNVITQLDAMGDFIYEIAKNKPEYETYTRLFDYVAESLYDVHEKIKTL